MALGAVAAHGLFGRATPVRENRGRILESPVFDVPVLVTVHPSSVLRERDSDGRRRALAALVEDLRVVHSARAG